MNLKNLKYRDNDYFNDSDTFLFQGPHIEFKSKVHFEKGYWWTSQETGRYKCTSLPCVKIEKDI